MNSYHYLQILILLPLAAAFVPFLMRTKSFNLSNGLLTLAITCINLYLTVQLHGQELVFQLPWIGYGFEILLNLNKLNSLVLFGIALSGVIWIIYSISFLAENNNASLIYGFFLLTIGFSNGALLADNLLLLLFFWESLLIPLFGMILCGGKNSFQSAIKAVIISGVGDLMLMTGTVLVVLKCGALPISKMHIPLEGSMNYAFLLIFFGAIAKAGSVPFHTWIPDAATEAPLPFMAILPACIEKFLGIYLVGRIVMDMFIIAPNSAMSIFIMSIGVAGILAAVLMALIQKDYKKLLAYHAISQVGYMILGIGTGTPVGMIGGLFHMFNHVVYKFCLFLTAGAVEFRTSTTDLNKLGGLFWKMPITFISFLVAAFSISGVPPFNGFFSKELVYDGALEAGKIFYFGAIAGSFLTAASFLKLGHAVYFGKPGEETSKASEAPVLMLIPMITLASLCVYLGLYNQFPITKIEHVLGEAKLAGKHFYGWPHSTALVVATVIALVLAVINHIYGYFKSGKGIGAVDHIHHAPFLSDVYDLAEKKAFDPFEIGKKFINSMAMLLRAIDSGIDWIYEGYLNGGAKIFSDLICSIHTGSYSVYMIWSLVGSAFIIAFLVNSL
ncbi:MAG: NADH-quinone oxidoreductase subunit L [Candidatus Riflebacteria bacterium]|nr:NADH-quinone oxidoreductase subunit L [Candidatus Riflebacteria bacterium]